MTTQDEAAQTLMEQVKTLQKQVTELQDTVTILCQASGAVMPAWTGREEETIALTRRWSIGGTHAHLTPNPGVKS